MVSSTTAQYERLAVRLRDAYAARDMTAIGQLLCDDVDWGTDDSPRRCRTRDQVVDTLTMALRHGADGEIVSMDIGTAGILAKLVVRWLPGDERPEESLIYHVYRVRGERVSQILAFDDEVGAREAAGVAPR